MERRLESARTVFAGFLILAAITVLPLIVVGLPPILDYPNHMARMHILAALGASSDLARYYAIVWTPVPDLAIDAIVPWLARVMPVETAMRLFLAFILLGLAGGSLALHRAAFRRWSIWPLFAFLALYNRMLLWGFLNYLAGLALALWALAAWIAIERRPLTLRIGLGAVFATVIYLAHLAAFGCYALALVAFQIAPREKEAVFSGETARRLISALITLAPPVALFLLSPTSGAPVAIHYGNPLRKLDLPVSIFDNYNRIFDGATFGILLIAVIVGLARRKITLHPTLRWSLIAVLIAFVVLPGRLLSASGIDHRLPIAIAFLFLGLSDWTEAPANRRLPIALALLALFLIRMVIIGDVWVRADRQYDRLLPVFASIPRGATLAIAAPARDVRAGGVPLLHFPTLAAIARDVFVPTLFADPAQQPVRLTDAAAALALEAPPGILWRAVAAGAVPPLPGYDDLMIVDPPRPLDPAKLPGRILFDAPRLMLVELPPAGKGTAP